jgi:hypothetical protein
MDKTKLEYKMTRQQTNYLLELIDSGLLDARDVVTMALQYMSEDEVADMMVVNDILDEEYDDEEDWIAAGRDFEDSLEEIDPVSEAQEWTDFDPDC